MTHRRALGTLTVLLTLSALTALPTGRAAEPSETEARLQALEDHIRIEQAGGTPTPIVELSAEGPHPRWPQWLPGNRHVLFTAISGPASSSIEVISLDDGASKTLIRGGTYARYLANGTLVYVNRGTLFAVPFDIERLELRGTPVAVLREVSYSPVFGFAHLDAARNGTVVYRRGGGSELTHLAWLDSSGRVSPDGRQIAFAVLEDSDFDIWTYDLATRARSRVTMADGDQGAPLWTPDGKTMLYGTQGGELLWQPRDRSSAARQLLPGVNIPWSFSPDGRRLAFHGLSTETGFDLWTVAIDSQLDGLHAGTPELFFASDVYETYPTFSPDGNWIAYGSNQSGIWQVYVGSFPNTERVDHRLMAADYRVIDGEFLAEPPYEWSAVPLADTGVVGNFDFAPDGARALVLLPVDGVSQAGRDRVTLVLNFFEDLELALQP